MAALVAQGYTDRQLATALGISEETATRHVKNILRRLGVHSRAQIAAWVVQQRLAPRAATG